MKRDRLERKKLRLELDHIVNGGESRHAFRKSWPRKKAFLNRSARKGANQALASVQLVTADSDDVVDDVLGEVTGRELRFFTRKRLRKWGVARLGDYVANRLERRYDQELGLWGRIGYDRNRISGSLSRWHKNRNKHWARRAEYLLKLMGKHTVDTDEDDGSRTSSVTNRNGRNGSLRGCWRLERPRNAPDLRILPRSCSRW